MNAREGVAPRKSIARSPYFMIFAAVAFVAALIAGLQVEWGENGNSWTDASMTVYAVMKLFLFDSVLEGDPGPPVYEVARWLAPMTTAAGVLAVFEVFAVDLRLRLHPVTGNHVVVLGCGERSRAIMHEILGWKEASGVVCVVPDTTPLDDVRSLKSAGIQVVAVDYDANDTAEEARAIARIHLESARGIISMEPEPATFGHVRWLAARAPKGVGATVHVNSESRRLREIVERDMDNFPDFDMHYFSLSELASYQLLGSGEFSILPPALDASRRFMAGDPAPWNDAPGRVLPYNGLTFEQIDAAVAEPHVLVVGMGQVGGELLAMLANLGITSPNRPLRVTAAGRGVGEQIDDVFAQVEDLSKVIDLTVLDLNPESRAMRDALAGISAEHPFSAAVYALEDARGSLLSADFMMPVLAGINTAVWCPHRADVDPILNAMPEGSRIRLFGLDSEVLNPGAILAERYLEQARHFNLVYAQTDARIAGGLPPINAQEAWTGLSTVKKESSFAQALHRHVKGAVLDATARAFAGVNGFQLINHWERVLEGLTAAEQADAIAADPLLSYMSALEHRRWATFYYLRGFTWGETKDEVGRTHDCLVDDWDAFIAGPRRETIAYDAFASLILDGPE